MTDSRFSQVLDRYNARAATEAERWKTTEPGVLFASRDEFLLHIGPETAGFLVSLVAARGAKRIVELGTSYGYSTLFLAQAASRTGGRVSSYELSPEKQAYAQTQLQDAGLAKYVDWRLGDAVELLDDEPDGVDFVLLDLWKDLYVPCFEKLYPKLADNALIAADNMLLPAMARPHAEAYRAAVRAARNLDSVLLPIGSGIELSCLWRSPPA